MKRSTWLIATGGVIAVMVGSAAIAQSQPGSQRGKAAGEQWNSLSKQQKADYCNQAAQKKGLTGRDRANFVKDCVNAHAAPKQ